MTKTIENLRGGVARVAMMTGPGWPQINFAPDDEKGAGDPPGDDAPPAGDPPAGDPAPSRMAGAGGLLGKRTPPAADPKEEEGDDKKGLLNDGRPEHVPAKFWDAEKKAPKYEEMAKSYGDLEKQLGTLKRSKSGADDDVPADEAGYFKDGITLPDEVDRLELLPDDPGLKVAGAVFLKEGIGAAKATRIITEIFKGMNEHMPEPIDPDKEHAKLGKGADALIDATFSWLEGGELAGKFSSDDIDVAMQLGQTAAGVRFLAKMRAMSGEQAIPIDPGTGQRGMSQEQWHEEHKAAVKAKDYKRQDELEEMGKFINGTDPSHGGRAGGVNSEKSVARR